MRRELEQMIVRIPACERGFDSNWPLPWLHPSGPEDLETLETVRMLLVNISQVAGFGAAQLAAGQVFEDERTSGRLRAPVGDRRCVRGAASRRCESATPDENDTRDGRLGDHMPIRADQEGSILTHSAPGVLRTVDGRTFAHVAIRDCHPRRGARRRFVADSGITASTAIAGLTDVVAAGTTGELNVALSAGAPAFRSTAPRTRT